MHSPIIAPIVALTVWTMIIWIWMYATRLPAMSRAKIDGIAMVGSTGRSLRDQLVAAGEERASWVADSDIRLMTAWRWRAITAAYAQYPVTRTLPRMICDAVTSSPSSDGATAT